MRETSLAAQRHRVVGRHAGPAGRVFRIVAGTTGLLPVIVKLDSPGAVLSGLAWLVAVAAFFIGIVALLRPWLDGSRERILSPWTGSAILLLPLMAYPFGLIPDGPVVGVRLFTDSSVLLSGLIGYGGLEMAALPALVLRFRPRLYSQYNVVDLVENAPGRARNRPLAAIASAVGILACAWFWIIPNIVVDGGPLESLKEPTTDLDGVMAAVIVAVAVMLSVARVNSPAGRTDWALVALVTLFGAGAAVGAMPDALYAAIIVAGAGVAVASLRRSRSQPSPAPAAGSEAPRAA